MVVLGGFGVKFVVYVGLCKSEFSFVCDFVYFVVFVLLFISFYL